MVRLLFVFAAVLALQGSPQPDTASADPFAMSKWEIFKRGTSERHPAYIRGNTGLRANVAADPGWDVYFRFTQ